MIRRSNRIGPPRFGLAKYGAGQGNVDELDYARPAFATAVLVFCLLAKVAGIDGCPSLSPSTQSVRLNHQ